MLGLIPDSFIDELLARVDIIDVVGKYVTLKKAGREWAACCPFHDERTPSFYVSPVKQFYHCFGCGAHGSAIRFLMHYERLEFRDAVEELAQSAGLTMPHEIRQNRHVYEEKTAIYALLDASARWYQENLSCSTEAKDYCRQRGIDETTIQKFRLGWAPGSYDGLIKTMASDEHAMQHLLKAGMISCNQRGHHYDRFRQRLMFPIMDRRGRVIAFGGRIIQPPHANASSAGAPKYLNSPETPLFHKGRELFALWQVKQANTKLSRVLVVEGYLDAISLHQAGIPIAVATLGTSTTAEHAETLFRGSSDVVFCFDGDRAGRDGAWNALEATLSHLRDGRQAYFLFLPEGEDPDSLIRKEGRRAFEKRLRHATPLSDYFFDELTRQVDSRSLDGRARLADRARPLLAQLPGGTFRELMEEETEKRTGVRVRSGKTAITHRAIKPVAAQNSLVRKAITLLLAQPYMANEVEKPYRFTRLHKPGVALLADLINTARERPHINPAMLVEHFAQRSEHLALQKLLAIQVAGTPETQRIEFRDALQRMEQQAMAMRRNALQIKMREGTLHQEEKNELRELLAARIVQTPLN